MIENINKINVSKNCIEKLKNSLSYDELISIDSNYEIINNNIKLLQSYGIENMDELFLNRYHIFIEKTETLAKRFSKYNIPVYVQIINNDFSAIDEIM